MVALWVLFAVIFLGLHVTFGLLQYSFSRFLVWVPVCAVELRVLFGFWVLLVGLLCFLEDCVSCGVGII